LVAIFDFVFNHMNFGLFFIAKLQVNFICLVYFAFRK